MFVYTCGRKVTTRTEAHLSFLGGHKPQDFVRDLLPCSPQVILIRKAIFHHHFCLMLLRTSCMSDDLKICRLHLVLTRTQRTLIKQWRVQNTSATTWGGVLSYWKIKLMQKCFLFVCLPLLLLRTVCSTAPGPVPTILSALYGYDGCIGGVNNFATEEEYLRELKRFWICTTVNWVKMSHRLKIFPIFYLHKILNSAFRRNCTVVMGPGGMEVILQWDFLWNSLKDSFLFDLF